MSASYTVMEYLGIPLAAGLGGLAVILTVSIWLPLKLKHKFTSFLLPILLFLLPIFACIALCVWLFPVFDTLGDILVPSEYTARTTAGKIETVTDSDLGTFHFHNGALRAGEEIVIDGASYYVISEGKLTEGMHIAVEYAQFENNVILSWREVSEEEAQKIRVDNPYIEFEMHDEKPQPTVSEKDMRIGSRLEQIGFVGFVAYVVLTNAFSQKIKTFFANRDTAQSGEIKPYTAWLLFQLIPFVFMSLIIVGTVYLTGQSYALLILVIGGGGILVFTHINLFTLCGCSHYQNIVAEGAAEGHCNLVPMAEWICSDHSSRDIVFRAVDIYCALAAGNEVVIVFHLAYVPDAGGVLILYGKLKNSSCLVKPALPAVRVKLNAQIHVVYGVNRNQIIVLKELSCIAIALVYGEAGVALIARVSADQNYGAVVLLFRPHYKVKMALMQGCK